MAEREVRYCTTEDGVRIAYIDVGEGYPYVALQWLSTVAKTGEGLERKRIQAITRAGLRFISFDLRGIGSSQREVPEISLDTQLRDLEAVVQRTAIDRLILHATRPLGQVAITYAARHPEEVTKLILISPYANGEDRFAKSRLSSAVAKVWQSGDMHAYAAMVASLHGMDAASVLQDTSPEMIAAYEDARQRTDVSDSLAQIQAPTLVVQPSNLDLRSLARRVAAGIPNARFISVPSSSDGSYVTRIIADFLGEDLNMSKPAEQAVKDASPASSASTEDLDRPRVRYARTSDRVDIAYCAVGAGKPLVMMNTLPWHHFVHDWDNFKAIAAVVTPRGRMLVTFDARGLGSSSAADDLSLGAYVSDLEAVVDALDIDVFDLTAVTYSCPVAITYAAKYPDRVSHLALVAPFVRGREALDTEVGRAVRALRDQEWELYTETSMYLITGWNKEQAQQAAAFLRAAATPEMVQRTHDAVDTFDVTEELSRVQCPTLVTHRKSNLLIPIDESRRVAAGIHGAQFVEVNDDAQALLEIGGFLGILTPSEVQSGRLPVQPAVARGAAVALATTSDPAVAAAASPFRTVLFTDLVGHTEMMQRLGDEQGRAVLREHERITREVLQAHGGVEVKTMGDGFMASFASVTKAVECAIALQRAFGAWNREGGGHPSLRSRAGSGPPLRVRVGLNAGEPIAEEGDLFGSTVILASRVAGQAGAGEILIPEPVRHLLAGKDFLFTDRGEVALKGFEDAVRLYEVRWQEEPS